MPVVDNINVPPESEELFSKACTINYGFYGVKVDKKNIMWRKRNFPSLVARSALPTLADRWNALTTAEQEAWDDAGYWSAQSGWDLFAQDTLYRVANSIPGVAIPSLYHQFKVGEIRVEAPAEEIKIYQQYNGNHSVPVRFFFNGYSDLVSTGGGSFAKITVGVYFKNWNGDSWEYILWDYDFDLTEFTMWDYFGDEFAETGITIIYIKYTLHIYKMRGVAYIEGIEFIYDDQNFALDWQCNDIQNNWTTITKPTGASYQSIYPADE